MYALHKKLSLPLRNMQTVVLVDMIHEKSQHKIPTQQNPQLSTEGCCWYSTFRTSERSFFTTSNKSELGYFKDYDDSKGMETQFCSA